MVASQSGMLSAHMQSPVDTSYLADAVVLLRYFESMGHVKKAISVLKKRSGKHEETIRELRFDSKGIHVSEPLTQFQGVLSGTPMYVGNRQFAEIAHADGESIRRPVGDRSST